MRKIHNIKPEMGLWWAITMGVTLVLFLGTRSGRRPTTGWIATVKTLGFSCSLN